MSDHVKEIECTTCGETKRWDPVDENTARERTAFIVAHAHGQTVYADTDLVAMQESTNCLLEDHKGAVRFAKHHRYPTPARNRRAQKLMKGFR